MNIQFIFMFEACGDEQQTPAGRSCRSGLCSSPRERATIALSDSGLLSYDPGGGHTDQLRDLSLALAVAELTDRRVVWPAYFHHRDVNVWTDRRTMARLARRRPRLSSIIEVVRSPVQLIEQPTTVHDFPRCDEDGENASCVVWIEPPEANASVSAALRAYATLRYAPWLHFRSMLDVLGARLARPRRYPLATWERELEPAACTLRYRADVLEAARRALRGALSSDCGRSRTRAHLATHVRALRKRDRGKAECEAEWVPRLRRFVTAATDRSAAAAGVVTLYIASDSLRTVLPTARRALGNLSMRVEVVSARDADSGTRVHPDSELSGIALDVAAVIDAAAFSAAPRSGLSVHLAAMRACERGEACRPALGTCTPFASTGCGGRFPPGMLRSGYDDDVKLREAARVASCRSAHQGRPNQRRRCERDIHANADQSCSPAELVRYGMGEPAGPMSDRDCERLGASVFFGRTTEHHF